MSEYQKVLVLVVRDLYDSDLYNPGDDRLAFLKGEVLEARVVYSDHFKFFLVSGGSRNCLLVLRPEYDATVLSD